MKDLVITVNVWDKNDYLTLSTIFATSDIDSFCNTIKYGNIFTENDDIVILIWKDGVMEQAYSNVNIYDYNQILESIKNYFEKENGGK